MDSGKVLQPAQFLCGLKQTKKHTFTLFSLSNSKRTKGNRSSKSLFLSIPGLLSAGAELLVTSVNRYIEVRQ
jgi:hypothetical protein